MSGDRLLIVAQSPVLRIGIRGILEAAGGLASVAEAGTGLEAAAAMPAVRPTLIVVQDALPGVTGVVAARMLREMAPAARVIVLTDEVDDGRVVAAVANGVDALLPSAIDGVTLVGAIRALADGRRPLNDYVLTQPNLAARILEVVRADASAANGAGAALDPLSGREIAILDGMVRGLTNREIAGALLLVEQTVKNHVTTLLRKLRANDRTSAVVVAARNGFVDLSAQLPPPPAAAGDAPMSTAA